ncbi:MAG TPA: acyl-CoA thioesterase [Ohtaekwangia sp.]
MNKYAIPLQIRWSDIDQNRHLRHSVYYDYGAMMRMNFLTEHGLSLKTLEEMQIGPILFREEAQFRREIKLEDKVTLDVELTKSTADFGRWSLRHNFVHADGSLATRLTIDGAWMDLEKRKLAIPGEFIRSVFDQFPKSEDFQLVMLEKKA